MTTIIDEVRFPEAIEQGSKVGPMFSTSVNSLISGIENRNSNWQSERLVADIGFGIMSSYDPTDQENSYLLVLNFFRARRGKYRGFLFKDPTDNEATMEGCLPVINVANAFQLGKSYDSYFRKITRPIADTIVLYNADHSIIADTSYTLEPFGVIQFLAARTDAVFASFDFCVPMRFDQDDLSVALTHIQAGEVPDIKLIQVLE